MTADAQERPVDGATVSGRIAAIHDRIRCAGGDPAVIELLGVTKGFGPDVVPVALGAGLRILGENYAQELITKAAWLAERPGLGQVAWHFIGQLQRNKVRLLAPYVSLWQSIDRPELVAAVARLAPAAAVLIQVNTTAEPQKGGCAPAEVADLVEGAQAAGLVVQGLMTVGPTETDTDPRPAFEMLRGLVDRLGLTTCSMGMSDDLEQAVQEGTNMVRIGRALFGPRPR